MSKSKEYLHVKNYLHNELGIHKDSIDKKIDEWIENKMQAVLEDKLNSKWFTDVILDRVVRVITSPKDYSLHGFGRYGGSDAKEFITRTIVDEVRKQVTDRIKFSTIEVK